MVKAEEPQADPLSMLARHQDDNNRMQKQM